MNLRSTCGIVLRINGHSESDKLVTFYSPDLGRVTGIAKGAKNSKRRFVNKLEEFSLLHIFYRPPKGPTGLLLINEAELLNAHLSLRTDFRKYVAAGYICELVARFTRDNDPDMQVFALLKWAIETLDKKQHPQQIALLTHLRLLDAVGYRPELSRCNTCRKNVEIGCTYIFLPGAGNLLCNICHPRAGGYPYRLSVQTLRLLASGQTFELERLHRLHFSRQALDEAMTALHHFTLHLLQQDVHSWSILRALPTVANRHPKVPNPFPSDCPRTDDNQVTESTSTPFSLLLSTIRRDDS